MLNFKRVKIYWCIILNPEVLEEGCPIYGDSSPIDDWYQDDDDKEDDTIDANETQR